MPEAFAEMMRAKNPDKFDPLATMSRLYVPVKRTQDRQADLLYCR